MSTSSYRKFNVSSLKFIELFITEKIIDDLQDCVDAEIVLFSKYYHILPEVPKSVLVVDEVENYFRLRLLLSSSVTEDPKQV